VQTLSTNPALIKVPRQSPDFVRLGFAGILIPAWVLQWIVDIALLVENRKITENPERSSEAWQGFAASLSP
jgi:hypothetical protein